MPPTPERPDADAVCLEIRADDVVEEGGVLAARLRITAARDALLQSGALTLSCTVAYRYTELFFGAVVGRTEAETTEVARQDLPAPTLLRGGRTVEHDVLLSVPPQGPPTVDSRLVQVTWSLVAVVGYDGDLEARSDPVPVLVRGAASGALADAADSRRPADLPALTGVLARRFHPGDVLTGDLVLEPRRTGEATVHVELVLRQRVPHGPWIVDDPARNPAAEVNEEDTVIAHEVVLDAHRVRAGQGLRRPFALRVPDALPAPTLVTDAFSIRWVLRAVARRRLGRAVGDERELLGSTTPR